MAYRPGELDALTRRNVRAPEARFWSKIDKHDNNCACCGGCWWWTASVKTCGYARFTIRENSYGAHRFAYELVVGPIPEGLVIDHLCRNPRCMNPAHMEPVTQAENILRGTSPSANNARKDRCHNGHLYTPETALIQPRNGRGSYRKCVICARERDAERRDRANDLRRARRARARAALSGSAGPDEPKADTGDAGGVVAEKGRNV